MIKVLWISNAPSPYKVELMNLLGQDVELTCLFTDERENDRDKSWYSYNFESFKAYYIKSAGEIFKYAIKGNYDILINSYYTNPYAILLTALFRIKGKKVILHADGGIFIDRGFIINHGISLVMKMCNYYFSSGKETNKYFNAYGIKTEKIMNYHFSSINQEDLIYNKKLLENKDALKIKHKLKEDFILLSVGQQIPRKGYDILIEAMKECSRDIGVYIVGGNPEESNQKLIEQYGLSNIHFINFMNKKDLMEYYASSDIFVLPTREDIWGLVINEAISCGLPIISTEKCVAAVQINEEFDNALIVPIEDSNVLAKAIMEVYNSKELQIKLAKNSFEASKIYTIEQTKEDFVNNINEIVGK